MFFRLFANTEIPFGEPGLLFVSLHHHHPVQLFDRHGDIQTKIHRATLRTVGVQGELLNGYVVSSKGICAQIYYSCAAVTSEFNGMLCFDWILGDFINVC